MENINEQKFFDFLPENSIITYKKYQFDFTKLNVSTESLKSSVYSYDAFNKPDIEYYKRNFKTKTPLTYVGLIHADINGAITVTNYVTETGIDPNVFSECDFVIAGHIHKKQEIKKNGVKIVYCSSISQKDFGESITGHGYVLWDVSDPEDITYDYIEVPNPEGGYYNFEINSIEDIKEDREELINL